MFNYLNPTPRDTFHWGSEILKKGAWGTQRASEMWKKNWTVFNANALASDLYYMPLYLKGCFLAGHL